MREHLISAIKAYEAYNEQEERDQEIILLALQKEPDLFRRENLTCHMTASAWVVNPKKTKTIMAYHKIYDSYAWLGGHADGNEDLSSVALKEVMEESGVKNPRLLSEDIFSLEILTVDGHVKNGKYVPSHLHFNVTYLIEADETEDLQRKEDENLDVKWFSFEEALLASKEPWFVKHIYSKLVKKLERLTDE